MFFSYQTIALVATLSAALPTALAGPIEERGTSLCNQQYYGATGFPWQSSSTPGSFCSSNKPSGKQWKSIPSWDGGDSVRCSTSNGKKNYKVCNGGNSKSGLPKKCNPPHNYPSGWGKSTSTSAKAAASSAAATVSCGSTTTCTAPLCSASYWWDWNCLYASNWVQTCVTTPKVCTGTTSTAAATTFTTTDTSVPSSAVAAISAIVNNGSAVPSSAIASTTTLSFATTYTDSASSAVATDAASVTTSTAAAATSSAAAVDPLQYPVCQSTYQVTYQNYTMVAPNGVWAGMTVGSATQDASYMTYTLATSISDCLAACDQIEGCVFVNTYYDVNAEEADLPKHTPGVLTCSMYSQCVGTDKNDNFGGQDDPNTIVNSNGYCKSGACSS